MALVCAWASECLLMVCRFDVAAYSAGLEDAMNGAEAMLTDEEINTEMSAFQERRQAEAEAERVAQAQSNLEAGRAYMEEMSANDDVQTTESGAAIHRDGARRG
jgi:FKBP-type peptidyl-prolyl cis-trans isomerase